MGGGLLQHLFRTGDILALELAVRQRDGRPQVAGRLLKRLFQVRLRALRISQAQFRDSKDIQGINVLGKQIQDVLAALLRLL